MENFRVTVTDEPEGVKLVTIYGAITADTAGPLSETLLGCLDRRPVCITIDLAGVGYLASPGIGALVSFLRKVKQVGGELLMRGVQPNVLELFRVTHLDKVFTIAPADTVSA